MSTITAEADSAVEANSDQQPRRSRRPRRSEAGASAAPRRSRRARVDGADLVATLANQVDQLIKENRELKRALARAEQSQGGGDLGQATRVLSGLQRRLNRALDTGAGSRRRRAAAAAAPAPRPRR